MLVSVCAPMGAQTLTKRYVELADSADYYMTVSYTHLTLPTN